MPQGKFRFLRTAILSFLAVSCASTALAQIQLVIEHGSTAQNIANGGALNITSTGVNQSVQLTLLVTNTGPAPITFSSPQLVGDMADFSVTLNAFSGNSTSFLIVFTPSTVSQVSALLTIPYTITPSSGASSSGSVTLNLNGTTAGFLLSYVVPPLSNATAVSNGGTIQFPATPVGNSVTATLAITNNGTATGTINGITVSGAAFQTQSLPLLPGNIASGQTLQVSIVYKPTGAPNDTGTVTVTLPSQTITINLTGTSPQLQYQVTQGSQTSAVSPGQAIAVTSTNVGTNTTVSVSVTNSGSSAVTISAINVSGQGFQLGSAPSVPLTLAANATAGLTFTFTPPQAGTFNGTLQVGSDSFPLSAKGLAAAYTYSYAAGSNTVAVLANGAVFFPPTQVGQSNSTTFTITNGGTVAGTISGIFVGQGNSPFSLSNLPPLPVTIAPAQSIAFQVTFTPTVTGTSSGTLQLDGIQFALSGPANPPPALPSYSFTGASGTQAPLQQVAVGLTLASAYPVALSGTLTMNVVPDSTSADPAIQFSSGGRSVNFTIPANSVNAVFANGVSSIKLQTGSTAGTITLVPSFQTAGGAQLTPSNPPALQLAVPAVAPQLAAAQITAQAAAGITLAVSGVANAQKLSHIDFTFTPAAKYDLSATTITVPLTGVASAWFASAAAQAFGGQFVVTVPFSLTSSTTSVKTPLNAIASISITVTNDQGTSAPVTIALQ